MKKLYQLISYILLFLACSTAYASSKIQPSPTPIKAANLVASGNIDYRNFSGYPYDLASTSLSWTKQGGAYTGWTYGYGISADNSGNIYVTGTTTKGLFGQTQTGTWDYFIIKYDQNSNLLWSRQVGAADGTTQATGISADNSGNIYVTGYTNKGISGQIQNGDYDYFIAKYNPNGNLIWTRQVGGDAGWAYGSGISADNSGNIYVTGYTTRGISGQTQTGYYDYFIAKYDTNGNLTWTKQVGTSCGYSCGYTYGYGISTDNSGNIYVTGYTNAGISGQTQNGNWDYFIAKYDINGNLIWSKQVGAAGGNTRGLGISADHSGNIYVTGYTKVGVSGQTQNGNYDYFIAKYNANSNLIWSRQVGVLYGNTQGHGIRADNLGNIYVTGYTNKGISGQIQNGGYDYFIAQYDVTGNLAYAKQVGGIGGDTGGNGISADSLGNIYVTGYTTVGISGQKQNGYKDYFIARYIN